VDANICGDCPGPCLNFCDKDALHWGDDLVDLRLVKAQVEGTMKPEEVAEARVKHKKELAEAAKRPAAEAAARNGEGVIALTRNNFERELLRAQVPVVVDCWADWCNPCKQFSPIFEATAKQYVGVIKFAKLDTEAEPALAQGLGVQALPTTLMFYKGQLVNVAEGALSASQFQAWLYQTLTAIRQYEKQLSAEAETAIAAAVQNLASIGGITPSEDGLQPTDGSSQGVIVDSHASTTPPEPPVDSRRQPEGKQTSSGLYIP
jgi:thioredoxin 2